MYAREKNHGNLKSIVERALGAIRVAPNSTLKMSLFEARHVRLTKTFIFNIINESM